MKRACVYRCVSSIMWVREAEHTLLVDGHTQRSWTLSGTEAMIWDFVALDYTYEHIVQGVAYFLGVPEATAVHRIQEILRLWHTVGIIETSEPWPM